MKLFLLSAALMLAGCGARERAPSRIPVHMAVAGQADLIYLSATLAQELGFYADEGLAVSIDEYPDAQRSLESVNAGSSDVICGFYDHTIQMQGQQLRAFATMLRYPGLVAITDAPGIARIEDLKGRTVGVSANGSWTQTFLNYLLVTHGLKPTDVNATSIGIRGAAAEAIESSKVDAAVVTEPALAMVLRQLPKTRVLVDTRTAEGTREAFGVETYPSVVLYAKTPWLNAHPEQARLMAHALTRTGEWMRSHSAEEIRQRMPPQFRSEDPDSDIEGIRAIQGMLSPDLKLTPESAEAVRKVLSVSLDSARNVDLDRTYTNEFVGK